MDKSRKRLPVDLLIQHHSKVYALVVLLLLVDMTCQLHGIHNEVSTIRLGGQVNGLLAEPHLIEAITNLINTLTEAIKKGPPVPVQ